MVSAFICHFNNTYLVKFHNSDDNSIFNRYHGHLAFKFFTPTIHLNKDNKFIFLNYLRQTMTKSTDVQMSEYFAEKAELRHNQSVLEATFKMHKCNNYF